MRLFFSISLIVIFTSCREAKETAYETEALDCVETLISDKNSSDDIIKTLKPYKNKFKFAADLEEKVSDKETIKNAESLISAGEFKKAKDALDERVVQRGYSEDLEKSLKILDSAIMINDFKTSGSKLEINEAVREFYRVKIQSEASFGKNAKLASWLNKQRKELETKASNDKKIVLRSISFTADYAALYKPEIFEVLLLQRASEEERITIPGADDKTDKQAANAIKSFGSQKLVENFYSYKRNFSPANLLDQLNMVEKSAKAGKTTTTLSSLKELQDIAQLGSTVRRRILKALFLAKGWNNASLINRDFMDISFLLETVYKANQE